MMSKTLLKGIAAAFLLLAPVPAIAASSGCGIAQINADFACTFDVKNSDASPYDLTGVSLEMQVKNRTGSVAAATFSTANGTLVIQSPATGGVVVLSVPLATMQTLAPGSYYWDLLQLNNDASRTFLGAGTWRVGSGVTESATPSPPSAAPLPPNGSDIVLTVSNPSLMLALEPSGPPGTGDLAVCAVVTTSRTIDTTCHTWPCDASAGDVTLTVPLGSTVPSGFHFTVPKIDISPHVCSVVTSGSDLIGTDASWNMNTANQSITFESTHGPAWRME